MEGRSAGVFLGTADEIPYNTNRLVVKINDNGNFSEKDSDICVDLKITSGEYNNYASDIDILSLLESTVDGMTFQAKNRDIKFNFAVYFQKGSLVDVKQGNRETKKIITLAEKNVLNFLHNFTLLFDKKKTGRGRYELKHFIAIYAYGRMFSAPINGRLMNTKEHEPKSFEVILKEENVNSKELQDKLASHSDEGFRTLIIFIESLFELHEDLILMGLPILANVKHTGSGFKWDATAFRLIDMSNESDDHFTINILKSIDLCNLLFHNKFFFDAIGITKTEDLDMQIIANEIQEQLKAAIIPTASLLIKSHDICNPGKNGDSVSHCYSIVTGEVKNKYGSSSDKISEEYFDRSENINWGEINGFLRDEKNVKSMFSSVIMALQSRKKEQTTAKPPQVLSVKTSKQNPVTFNNKEIYFTSNLQYYFDTNDTKTSIYTINEEGKKIVFSETSLKMAVVFTKEGDFLTNDTTHGLIYLNFDGIYLSFFYLDEQNQQHIVKRYIFNGQGQIEVPLDVIPTSVNKDDQSKIRDEPSKYRSTTQYESAVSTVKPVQPEYDPALYESVKNHNQLPQKQYYTPQPPALPQVLKFNGQFLKLKDNGILYFLTDPRVNGVINMYSLELNTLYHFKNGQYYDVYLNDQPMIVPYQEQGNGIFQILNLPVAFQTLNGVNSFFVKYTTLTNQFPQQYITTFRPVQIQGLQI